MNKYVVNTYDRACGIDVRVIRVGESADAMVPAGPYASVARRWQQSPFAVDRDNIQVQFDSTRGVAVWRVGAIGFDRAD